MRIGLAFLLLAGLLLPGCTSNDKGATDTKSPTDHWVSVVGTGESTGTSTFAANATHAYAKAGLFNVTFTVSDSKNTTRVDLRLNITLAAKVTGPVQSFDFAYLEVPAGCADAPPTMKFGTPAAGKTWAEWGVLPSTIGRPYKVTFTAANPVLAIGEVAFYDASDARIASSVTASTSPIAGTVPAGAAHGLMVDCAAGNISGHYQTA
jgi:PKD repeat protein